MPSWTAAMLMSPAPSKRYGCVAPNEFEAGAPLSLEAIWRNPAGLLPSLPLNRRNRRIIPMYDIKCVRTSSVRKAYCYGRSSRIKSGEFRRNVGKFFLLLRRAALLLCRAVGGERVAQRVRHRDRTRRHADATERGAVGSINLGGDTAGPGRPSSGVLRRRQAFVSRHKFPGGGPHAQGPHAQVHFCRPCDRR